MKKTIKDLVLVFRASSCPANLPAEILLCANRANKFAARNNQQEAEKHLFDLIKLICLFANARGIDLHKAVIDKYPGVCSYCVKAKCKCKDLLIRPDKASNDTLLPFRAKAIKWSLAQWVRRDWELYTCETRDDTHRLWRHFLSEAIEFATELLFTPVNEGALSEELADLFEKAVNLCGALNIDLIAHFETLFTAA